MRNNTTIIFKKGIQNSRTNPGQKLLKVTDKGKGHFLLNVGSSFSPSDERLLSMEADGAPSTPPLVLSVLRFMGIQSYGYTDQRKVEADVEVTEDRTGDLSFRKPRTSQLSHDCSSFSSTSKTGIEQMNTCK